MIGDDDRSHALDSGAVEEIKALLRANLEATQTFAARVEELYAGHSARVLMVRDLLLTAIEASHNARGSRMEELAKAIQGASFAASSEASAAIQANSDAIRRLGDRMETLATDLADAISENRTAIAEARAARARAEEPWKDLGISKATYYRRMNAEGPQRTK